MKSIKLLVLTTALGFSCLINAQDSENSKDSSTDKKSYYQKRAEEDAKFEQGFIAKTEAEEERFWEEQKTYENDLRQRDKKAYKAYMKGKRDAYANHYEHCDGHCHHSEHFYHHASFHYHGYSGYYYERYPRGRSSVRTSINIGTPKVRVGTPSLGLGLF